MKRAIQYAIVVFFNSRRVRKTHSSNAPAQGNMKQLLVRDLSVVSGADNGAPRANW